MQMFDPIGAVYKTAGEAAFYKLVEEFYARVEADPLLRPMYPADLEHSKSCSFNF